MIREGFGYFAPEFDTEGCSPTLAMEGFRRQTRSLFLGYQAGLSVQARDDDDDLEERIRFLEEIDDLLDSALGEAAEELSREEALDDADDYLNDKYIAWNEGEDIEREELP